MSNLFPLTASLKDSITKTQDQASKFNFTSSIKTNTEYLKIPLLPMKNDPKPSKAIPLSSNSAPLKMKKSSGEVAKSRGGLAEYNRGCFSENLQVWRGKNEFENALVEKHKQYMLEKMPDGEQKDGGDDYFLFGEYECEKTPKIPKFLQNFEEKKPPKENTVPLFLKSGGSKTAKSMEGQPNSKPGHKTGLQWNPFLYYMGEGKCPCGKGKLTLQELGDYTEYHC